MSGRVSVRIAARLLSCHEKTIRAWIKCGRLETGRISATGYYSVAREEVERVVRELEAAAADRTARYRARESG